MLTYHFLVLEIRSNLVQNILKLDECNAMQNINEKYALLETYSQEMYILLYLF